MRIPASESSPVHVLHLVSCYPTDEHPISAIFTQDHIKAISQSGVQSGIIFPEFRRLREFRLTEFRKQHFQISSDLEDDIPNFHWKGWNTVQMKFQIYIYNIIANLLANRYIQDFGKPHVIHAHNHDWAILGAHSLAKRLNVPFIATEHSTYWRNLYQSDKRANLIRSAVQAARLIITVGNELSNDLDRLFDRKCVIIPNPVDTQLFALPQKNRNSDIFKILFVGNLISRKNVNILIDAFAQFKKNKSTILNIVGQGQERDNLRKQVASLGLEYCIRFSDESKRSSILTAMQEANLLVLPSQVETFGVVIVEAMSTGIPVIATRCGGPESIIRPSTGLLVSPGDTEGLKSALEEMYLKRDYWLQCQNDIRRDAEQRFGSDHFGATMKMIYENL